MIRALLWTDNTAPYTDAFKAAGLAERITVETLPRKEKPSAEQLANTEVLMAYEVPPGTLGPMPKLRWIQSMTAGTERRRQPIPRVAEVLPPERWRDVLSQSDFVLLLMPATPETENFMNAERLGAMKPSAWLLNFGRGHLIKDDDLVAAVKAKKI